MREHGLEPAGPAVANFVFVRVGDAAALSDALLRQGVIVRPLAPFGAPDALRITAGTPEEIGFLAERCSPQSRHPRSADARRYPALRRGRPVRGSRSAPVGASEALVAVDANDPEERPRACSGAGRERETRSAAGRALARQRLPAAAAATPLPPGPDRSDRVVAGGRVARVRRRRRGWRLPLLPRVGRGRRGEGSRGEARGTSARRCRSPGSPRSRW